MSTATGSQRSSNASLLMGLLIRYPLTSFFVLAYALTWLAWSPWFLSRAGVGLLPYDGDDISDYLNAVALIMGPTLSAFIMTGATEGREGIRRLLRRIILWRVGLRWYFVALVGIPAIIVLSTLVLPGALASFQASAVPTTLFLYVVAGPVFLFAGGPVFEEIGWRGFALPRLQRLYGPLVGTLVLGVLWGVWHLPLFLIPSWDTPHGSLLDVALFVILAVSIAVVITWVFNNTKGSILIGCRVDVRPLSRPCRHRRHHERRGRLRVCRTAGRGPDPRPPGLQARSASVVCHEMTTSAEAPGTTEPPRSKSS
jgi:uncharacterized protein